MVIKMGRDEQHGYYIFRALLSWRIYSAHLYRSLEKRRSVTKSKEGKINPTHNKKTDLPLLLRNCFMRHKDRSDWKTKKKM
jgi:hypothetical protein